MKSCADRSEAKSGWKLPQEPADSIQLTLTRETIKVRSVRDRVEGDNVGYIRILQFNNLADDELKAAIKDISAKIPTQQLKGYILDLRNNPGGLLDQAVSVSDAFLKRGEIVSMRGRTPMNPSVSMRKPAILFTASH